MKKKTFVTAGIVAAAHAALTCLFGIMVVAGDFAVTYEDGPSSGIVVTTLAFLLAFPIVWLAFFAGAIYPALDAFLLPMAIVSIAANSILWASAII